MSLRSLSTEKMVQISSAWVDPKRHRKTLSALPLVAGLIAPIDAAHEGLLTIQTTHATASVDAELALIQEKQGKLDVRHDRKMRGTIGVLGGLAELADTPEEAQALLDLRDRLCPDGLRGTNKSYDEEAGAAKLLPARLDEASLKLLGKIAIPGGKLSDAVKSWTGAADELGALEVKKAMLLKEQASGKGARPADVLRARNQWIRVARALESTLAIAGDEATIEAILGPLHEAEARADRRLGGGEEAPEPAPEAADGAKDPVK
jgi:hypothetical protein